MHPGLPGVVVLSVADAATVGWVFQVTEVSTQVDVTR
jgi:hypothetical protein